MSTQTDTSFDLHTFGIELVTSALRDNHSKRMGTLRAVNSLGVDDDDLCSKRPEEAAKRVWVMHEEFVDDFLAFTINSFQQCWVYRPQLDQLDSKERAWMRDAQEAITQLYKVIKLPQEASGRFIRMQRIGDALFLLVPN